MYVRVYIFLNIRKYIYTYYVSLYVHIHTHTNKMWVGIAQSLLRLLTGLRAGRSRVRSPRWRGGGGWWGDFLHPSRPALGPIHPPVPWVPGHSRGKAAEMWL
jgi:hypothetical protein